MFALATCEYAFVTKIISKNFYSLYLYENLMQISLVMFVVIFSFFVVVVVQVVCVCVFFDVWAVSYLFVGVFLTKVTTITVV